MKKNYLVTLLLISLVVIFAATSSVHSQTCPTVVKHELSASPPSPYTETSIPFTDCTDSIYHVNDNLTIAGNNQGTHTGVVFVEEDLNITGNYCYGSTCPTGTVSSTVGTVFVVKGDVNIASTVTRIDAVIISQGTIYTAASSGTTCATSAVSASQLTINGSLVSLNPDNPVQFCRSLTDNSNPAEVINHQVKYLVILRHLLSDTYQKWSEVP